MPLNVPNLLTWLRILAIPLLVALYYLPAHWMTMHERNLAATILFAGAAVTDWLDGYLARRLNQQSAFGAFLDPVADKLMVAVALMVLVEIDRVSALVAAIIVGREIAISALREWMAKVGEAKSVAVNFLGKLKTAFQMIAIPMLLYHDPMGVWFDPQRVGTWLIYLAAGLTLASMFYYLKLASPRAFRGP
ncbi:MAG: CDP-diacylglycerol--glycerol-3-phosphate 3-phosphatidyltransferase [Burkholderiales bacterium]|nr:CDP-diacylglycerol--glycerol-3-phosphate 3-phosphatidyltransferase [Burkholderiales bacterium]